MASALRCDRLRRAACIGIGTALLPVLATAAPETGCRRVHHASGASAAPGARHYWDQPGGNRSVWNTPLGSGAAWGGDSDPDTQDLRHGGFINPPDWFGQTVWVGRADDPVFTLAGDCQRGNAHGTVALHLPAEVRPSGPFPGDNNTVYFDPIDHWGLVFSTGNPTVIDGHTIHGGWTETDDALSDTYGEDQETGLAGHSTAAGLIRQYDIDQINAGGHIRHMLRYATDSMYLKDASIDGVQKLGPGSWPQANEDDQTSGITINFYHGHLGAGTTIGIPMATPIPEGLTKGGQELFWTLQHYGALFRDQASDGLHFCDDQVADTSDIVAGMRRDLPTIVHFLAPLRNQHVGGEPFATSPKNGPGARLDTGPPPLAAD